MLHPFLPKTILLFLYDYGGITRYEHVIQTPGSLCISGQCIIMQGYDFVCSAYKIDVRYTSRDRLGYLPESQAIDI